MFIEEKKNPPKFCLCNGLLQEERNESVKISTRCSKALHPERGILIMAEKNTHFTVANTLLFPCPSSLLLGAVLGSF